MPLRENFWPPDGLLLFSANPHKGNRMLKRNAPLTGVRPIGSNMTEAVHGDLTVLYSYNTPVAFLSSQGGYRTSYKHSVTTSKHIRKFFDMHGYDFKGAFQLSQGDLEEAVEYGRVKSAGNPRRKLRLVPRSRKAQKRHADRLQRKARRFRRNPALTRAAFVFIADVINRMPSHAASLRSCRTSCANAFADALGATNPRFDRARFLKAAFGDDAASNPLAIYGAVNPPRRSRSNGVTRSVKDLGRVVEIRYRRKDDKGFYYHRFKTRPRLLALSDGTLAVRP
jgi:hypothetical protein